MPRNVDLVLPGVEELCFVASLAFYNFFCLLAVLFPRARMQVFARACELSRARLQVFARASELLCVRMQLFARGCKSSGENASLRVRTKAFLREPAGIFAWVCENLRARLNTGALFSRKIQGLVRLVEYKFASWF